ncbi:MULTISPECIES: periplasmic nitrate reductase, NapE protein [Halocynthiibacter]|uniref:Periplasmic nitrate reductase, NapE protein n=1 Tax=Halocynthiibacter halioticoli TaxID=2986804 RepID=A0AAE3LTA6_9RHOB|nr:MULTISPECIES: periplasmic nitrate reductase, NapE protein [Halocynthiibacter]MCV6824801.1 periplasmic nitrate reductase, NapE protein [Halocynthiibacter halioticoli]MCW4057802.1 periplasmic nitrate reductase, NapE protein [Halocynthiibacter sp. SDUM655004]MDE0589158.1 periplasmic nitrate reductase, NapE protein [Halocynthiibacter sp. C4]
MSDVDTKSDSSAAVSKKDERTAFIFLAVFLAPILAVAIVGGYGFMIWMSQIISGPPTG